MKLLRLTITALITLCCVLSATAGVSRLYTSDRLSSLLITSIAQDRRGCIWIGTQNGLNRFDGYHFTVYQHEDGNSQSLDHNNITTLFVDRDGQLWVGTPKGLARYNEATNGFVHQRMSDDPRIEPRVMGLAQAADGRLLIATSGFGLYQLAKGDTVARRTDIFTRGGTNDYYHVIHIDRQGRVWKADNNARVFCYTARGKLLLKLQSSMGMAVNILDGRGGDVLVVCKNGVVVFSKSLKQTFKATTAYSIGSATEGSDHELLTGTDHGLLRIGADDSKFSTVDIENSSINFADANVNAVFQDRQHNLWLGCAGRGLLFVSHQQQGFANWSLSEQGIKTGSTITTLTGAADGGLWAGLLGERLYHFKQTGRIDRSMSVPKGLNNVYRDHTGQLWACAGTTLYRLNEASGAVAWQKSFDCDFLQSVTDDGHGTLYLSTFGRGVTAYNTRTGATRLFSMFDTKNPRGFLCNNWTFAMIFDKGGLLWIATSSGVSCYNPAKDTFKTFGWHNLLEGYACLSLAEDGAGNILIGTDRGLFRFDRRRNRVARFPDSKELDGKTICAIMTLPGGDFWCSTSMGIWHYRHSDHRFIGHINDNGLHEREYANNVAAMLGDGRIAFGNSVSLIVFRPANISASVRKPANIALTALLVGGEQVDCETLSGGSAITAKPVPESQRFELAFADNTFTMEFSNFDYSDAANLTLEYRLNNDRWTQLPRGENAISFNHLPSGSYRLQVRAVENGQYSDVKTYTVVVRAPWWRTPLAFTLYVLFVLLLAGYITWRYWRRKQQQLAEEKMQLLINATHDIRTPLTLILSPLHQLMHKPGNDADTTEKLGIIDHNSRRILNLVNQILDIRKIDKQQMHLQCQETELVAFVNNIYKVFESHAKDRNITFLYQHPDELKAWVDRVQFDKVVQNLLSNAFKFTPDGGTIELKLTADLPAQAPSFTLSVTDTGTGLRDEDIPKLFTRFYQSPSNQAQGKDGTGIGLNLCKRIVELHHGHIAARNRTDGQQGSQFIVTMPVGNELLKPEELRSADETAAEPASETVVAKRKATGKRPHVMLVDDDAEITDYIAGELSANYRFQTCQNGKEALHELLSEGSAYDLVVTDIMMPEMDGFTLLRTIKSNPLLSHVPVILLTSEAAVGNRLEGLQHGADAFLAKPFLMDELQATMDNLLAKSVRMKDKFSGAEEERKEQVEQRDLADNDKALMDRIMQSINKNLDNSDYSVEQLAQDAGLSRSQLHRKMKELTGISPSDFIRNLRLEQAARLLRERNVNVSQVAYSVGFNTLGNFSKAFKQHFGMPPTEYAAQKG